MTIEERVNELMNARTLPSFRRFLRLTLLEVARDQRHACAEAVAELNGWHDVTKSIVHNAVMNAEIK